MSELDAMKLQLIEYLWLRVFFKLFLESEVYFACFVYTHCRHLCVIQLHSSQYCLQLLLLYVLDVVMLLIKRV